MEDKMAAEAFGHARNYGWDGALMMMMIIYTAQIPCDMSKCTLQLASWDQNESRKHLS